MGKQESSEKAKLEVKPILLAVPVESSGAEAAGQALFAAESGSVLLFETGGEAFAIGVEQTDGVVDCPRITPLPDAPDGVIGVASVRGRMTLVMELSLQASAGESRRRLILLKGDTQLGLLAERVEGVVALPSERVTGGKSGRQKRDCRWAIITHFKHAGRDVPLIDVAALAGI